MQAFSPCQLALWEAAPAARPGGLHPLPTPGADVRYDPGFLDAREARALFERLLAEQPWKQLRRQMYDREVEVPRLQVWYGAPGGKLDDPEPLAVAKPWPPVLQALRDRLQVVTGEPYNAVLLNLYRDGKDSVAWHSDYEVRAGLQPAIASLTLGAARRFMMRPKPGHDGNSLAFDLPSGSLLLMGRGTQEHWEHHVPKTARPVGPRINLTFRLVPEANGR